MSTISIIGSGDMAGAIGIRAAEHGHAVEVIGRDAAKARALAERIGDAATIGSFGAAPAGDIVVLAVPYAAAVDAVAHHGDALAGKTIVDITNPFAADAGGLVTSAGNSISRQVAAVAPPSAHVVKAFNTIFRRIIEEGRPVDAFFAGDDPGAKAAVAAFLESLGMRPLDTGGLEMAHALEWAGVLLVNVARNGAGFDLALGAGAPEVVPVTWTERGRTRSRGRGRRR